MRKPRFRKEKYLIQGHSTGPCNWHLNPGPLNPRYMFFLLCLQLSTVSQTHFSPCHSGLLPRNPPASFLNWWKQISKTCSSSMNKKRVSSDMACYLVAINPPASQLRQHWINSYYAQGRALDSRELKSMKTGPLDWWSCEINTLPSHLHVISCILATYTVCFYSVLHFRGCCNLSGHRICTQNVWIWILFSHPPDLWC